MNAKVKPIPDGYHSITPYLIVRNGAGALDFYKKAFNAKELFRMPMPDGKIGHAEMQVGDSRFMLADENPGMGARSPESVGGSPINLMIYLEDVDGVVKQAVLAGATIVRPLANQFYGDRSGIIMDPFGHQWTLATHVEDVPEDELKRRAATAMCPEKKS